MFGFASKKNDSIAPLDVKKRLEEGRKIVLLDVRSKEEHTGLRIPNSLLIPVDELLARAKAELPDLNAEIIIYCHSGMRARSAYKILAGLGYTDVKSLGGIVHWPYETVSGAGD